jgi:hypothetical protein
MTNRIHIGAYKLLEAAMKRLDLADEATADLVRDVMNVVWGKLSDDEKSELNLREAEP